MKLPCILKTTDGHVVCLFENGFGYHLDGQYKGAMTDGVFHIASSDKNITAEYLANTYGKVESKEHAEFIKLLAEANDIPCTLISIDMNYTMFYVVDGCLFFCVNEIDVVGDYKLITIPLPPTNTNTPEEDFEMTQIAKNNGDNLMFGGADKLIAEVVVAGDGKVHDVTPLSEWQGDEVKFRKVGYSDKWPSVGDKVSTKNDYELEVRGLDGANAWCLDSEGDYLTFNINELKKPKTTEEELRDELKEIINTAMSKPLGFLNDVDGKLVDYMLAKYNITKKPQ